LILATQLRLVAVVKFRFLAFSYKWLFAFKALLVAFQVNTKTQCMAQFSLGASQSCKLPTASKSEAIQTKSSLKLRACAGFKTVRAGGHRLCSRDFQEAVGQLTRGQTTKSVNWGWLR